MPEFWQFPTVSMGLGPLDGDLPGALPEVPARTRHRRHLQTQGLGVLRRRRDGRARILGAIGLAAREKLDNLIFVVNCNLQRLDGPVRGNGKIIQELEGEFRGAGWNVIKLLWGSLLGPAAGARQGRPLRKPHDGHRRRRLPGLKANDGAFVRKHFFGRDPRTLEMVAKMSDDDIWRLNRGGHDPQARCMRPITAAVNHKGQPTVMLIKTVKGFGMGKAGEGKNTAHQAKKLTDDDIKAFRDRFNIPVTDEQTGQDCRSTSRPTTRRR
jgi:pyruvate dehydrogenase E1 component